MDLSMFTWILWSVPWIFEMIFIKNFYTFYRFDFYLKTGILPKTTATTTTNNSPQHQAIWGQRS